jgi:hypothetical protein
VRWVIESAHLLGIVPLAVMVGLAMRGQRREAGYWLMAGGFAVSFVADFFPHPAASQLYPITQAALFALVLLPNRPAVEAGIAAVLFAASVSIVARQGVGLDVLLHAVAWGSISALAWTQLPKGHLRNALTCGFGLAVPAWCWFVLARDWPSWVALQGTRVYAVGLFAWAVVRERRQG